MKLKQKILIALFLLFGLLASTSVFAAYGDTKTWLSKPYSGDGGSVHNAYLDFPEDVAFDNAGTMYIADAMNNVIRRVKNNIVTTFAGSASYGDADGASQNAKFGMPKGIVIDADKNVYVADTNNGKIKKIYNGRVKTIVSGLKYPEGVAVYGKTLYIADTGNNAIKKVSADGDNLETLFSNILSPKKLSFGANGNTLYVTEAGRYRVLKLDLNGRKTSVIAGSGFVGYKEGKGTKAQFRNLVGVAYDGSQNTLFVTDGDGFTDMLRAINLKNNETSLITIDKVMATINYPKGAAIYGKYVWVANSGIGTIQGFYRIRGSIRTGDPELYVGKERFGNTDGSKKKAILGRPYDMVLGAKWITKKLKSNPTKTKKYLRKTIYLAENNKIKTIDYKTGKLSWLIGDSVDNYVEGSRKKARFSFISSLVVDSKSKYLYVSDHWNNRIRRINLKTFNTKLISGSGITNAHSEVNGYKEGKKKTAKFNLPSGIAISKKNKYLYVSDTANQRIRKVRISDGKTWLLAGSGAVGYKDGKGKHAAFYHPWGITLDLKKENLFIADRSNHAIRKLNLKTKVVTTVTGCGRAGYQEGIGKKACLSYPEYVKMGADGNLYITEVGGHRIRVMEMKTGIVKLAAGSGSRGYKNGKRAATEFNNLKGLLPDTKKKRLFVADTWNDVIRVVSLKGKAPFQNPAPIVRGVGPDFRYPAGSYDNIMLYIKGGNFRYGAEAYFGKQKAVKTYVFSSGRIVVRLDFNKLSPGYYDVTIKNVDGQYYTQKGGFVVLNSNGFLPSETFRY